MRMFETCEENIIYKKESNRKLQKACFSFIKRKILIVWKNFDIKIVGIRKRYLQNEMWNIKIDLFNSVMSRRC